MIIYFKSSLQQSKDISNKGMKRVELRDPHQEWGKPIENHGKALYHFLQITFNGIIL